MSPGPNTAEMEGKPCALTMFEPCPGRNVAHRDGGCPHWVEGWPMMWQEDGALPTQIVFRGCQLSVFLPMLRGVSQTNTSNAAAVESMRNQIDERTGLMVNLARAFAGAGNGLHGIEETKRIEDGAEGSIEADNPGS